MNHLLEKLEGGDRRSIGRANEVATDVLNNPSRFGVVFNGMLSDDPLIRMRSADAVEKVTVEHPEYLKPHKAMLIEQIAQIEQQEVRWHVAQMIPRLDLSSEELDRVVKLLKGYLSDESRIVKTSSMQALADLVEQDEGLLPEVLGLLQEQTLIGSPAMKSRGRKLLAKLRAK